MKLLLALTAGLMAITATNAFEQPPQPYRNCKVIRVSIEGDTAELKKVVDNAAIQIWQPVRNNTEPGAFADFLLSPNSKWFWEIMGAKYPSTVMYENLEPTIKAEAAAMVRYEGKPTSKWFKSYHTYADHMDFLYDLQKKFPGCSKIFSSGTSVEGRNITGIHIHGDKGGKRLAVVLHATVHAREWITTMVAEYVAYKILHDKGSSPEIEGFLDKYDYYIIPLVNPDGFVYTQTHDRLWRKNRQLNSTTKCQGIDINRNWPYKWDVPGGASTDPCQDDFRGYSAGDTPEAQGLSAFLGDVKKRQGLKLYWDLHSYSQLFMTPYGYSCSAVSAKKAEYQSLAKGAAKAITKVHGTEFDYGPICQTIYQASGGSVDYVADVAKADYSVTAELRDRGRYGFLLPATQIVPTSEETFAGIKYVLNNIK